ERSEGLFISCTALRAAEVVATIEAACGVPVVTSNQASAWMCVRLAGIDRPIAGYGRLLSLLLPE
ncbi:MAG: ectoine utilization protein EutA, partial [Bauldia litoralis]